MIHYKLYIGGNIYKSFSNERKNNIEPSIIIYCRQGWFFKVDGKIMQRHLVSKHFKIRNVQIWRKVSKAREDFKTIAFDYIRHFVTTNHKMYEWNLLLYLGEQFHELSFNNELFLHLSKLFLWLPTKFNFIYIW